MARIQSDVVDYSKFVETLNKYKELSNKDMAEILPKKMRSLLWSAWKRVPLMDKEKLSEVVEEPRFVTWYAMQHLRRNGGLVWAMRGKNRYATSHSYETYNAAAVTNGHTKKIYEGPKVKSLASRRSARYFGRTPFHKAIKLIEKNFPATVADKGPRKARELKYISRAYSRINSEMDYIHKELSAILEWEPKDSRDKQGKEEMYLKACRQALNFEMRDMEKYIIRKLEQSAQQSVAK